MKSQCIKLILIVCTISVLFNLSAKRADAQAPTITGKVVSANTNAPVAGVWVKWTEEYGSYRYAQTDSTGTFTFTPAVEIGLAQIEANMNILIDATLSGVKDTPEWYDWGDSSTWADHFSCGDNPQTFSVNGSNGTYSTISGVTINNGNDTIDVGTITFTPTTFSLTGNVFIDTNQNGIKDNGEINYAQTPSISISPNTGSVTTNSDGSYTINNLQPGTYTISYNSLPSGYNMISPSNGPPPSFTVTVGSNCAINGSNNASCNGGNIQNLNFGIHPPYTVSGNIFNDLNKNGNLDNGESNYAATPIISTSKGTVTTSANGSYTISNIPAGAITVNYSSLPAGYYMTSPLNGPPPSFTVTVGQAGCSVNGAPGATCNAGNIQNLNFGITNTFPWFQVSCGDVRNDNGITDTLPAAQSVITTNATCTTPAIGFTGNTNPNLGQGKVSSSNQIVGGSSYPELFSSAIGLNSSYTSLLSKAQTAGISPIDLATVCNLTNCALPANLPHGIYVATGDMTIANTNYTFPNNANFVFLINGNLTFTGSIKINAGSTALFATTKNIIVSPAVGTSANNTNTSLEGWFVAGQSFIVQSLGNCNDLRLNIGGTVIVNTVRTGGTFQNNRDLCSNDTVDPTVTFNQRLDLILNAPQFLEQQITVSKELAP